MSIRMIALDLDGTTLNGWRLTENTQKTLEAAIEKGWTVRSYIDAVNVLKITGSTKKEDILKARHSPIRFLFFSFVLGVV